MFRKNNRDLTRSGKSETREESLDASANADYYNKYIK